MIGVLKGVVLQQPLESCIRACSFVSSGGTLLADVILCFQHITGSFGKNTAGWGVSLWVL